MISCPDGRIIDLRPADMILTFAIAYDAGLRDACRAAASAARIGGRDAKTTILARLRNGWAVVAFEPDALRAAAIMEAIAAAKAEDLPRLNLEHVLEDLDDAVPA